MKKEGSRMYTNRLAKHLLLILHKLDHIETIIKGE
jgi:hypothetical protein